MLPWCNPAMQRSRGVVSRLFRLVSGQSQLRLRRCLVVKSEPMEKTMKSRQKQPRMVWFFGAASIYYTEIDHEALRRDKTLRHLIQVNNNNLALLSGTAVAHNAPTVSVKYSEDKSFGLVIQSTNVNFSNVTSSHLADCMMEITPIRLQISNPDMRHLPYCEKNFLHHYQLLPFMYDNAGVLITCDRALKQLDIDSDEVQKFLTTLLAVHSPAARCKSLLDMRWEPLDKPCGSFSEDDWTRRLLHSLRAVHGDHFFSSVESSNHFSTFLTKLSIPLQFSRCFPFKGSPDILFKKGGVVKTTPSNEGELSELDISVGPVIEDGLVDDCYPGLPEHAGVLIAQMYVVLAAKIMRAFIHRTGEEIDGRYESNGMLLDKLTGIHRCHMYVDIRKGEECEVIVTLTEQLQGMVSLEDLCYQTTDLLQSC